MMTIAFVGKAGEFYRKMGHEAQVTLCNPYSDCRKTCYQCVPALEI